MKRRGVGFGTAVFILLAGCVMVSVGLVHLTWSRAAELATRNLLGALELQVASGARQAWWSRVEETETLARVVRAGLDQTEAADARERLINAVVSKTRAHAFPVLVHADGSLVIWPIAVEGAHPGPVRDTMSGMIARAPKGQNGTPGVGRTGTLLEIASEEAAWVFLDQVPGGSGGGLGYLQKSRGGAIALVLSFRQIEALFAEIPVGRTGELLVVAPDGTVLIRPKSATPETIDAGIVRSVSDLVARGGAPRADERGISRVAVSGAAFSVALSPLYFQGWQLAVIIPEADYLGEITRIIERVSFGILAFMVAAGLLVWLLARQLVARPVERLLDDIGRIQRFELEKVDYRPSVLREINVLSQALQRMSHGLADFGKFIPAELVRRLLNDGMRAEPGGSRQEITVLFADLAGFTRLSEELGDHVVPIVSTFLDLASREVVATGGTIDKFLGDAVMAFWGAPNAMPDHAARACLAAQAILKAFDALAESDPRFLKLGVRIGVQTGPAIVGNVGTDDRLNYTALGDSVNLASRLVGVNKLYKTSVLVGEQTAAALGSDFVLREVDTVLVYGRRSGVRIFELLDKRAQGWVSDYKDALEAYRSRDFERALAAIDQLKSVCPQDGPALRLEEVCRSLQRSGLSADWEPVTALEVK